MNITLSFTNRTDDFLFAMLCAHAIDLFLASVYESLNEIRQNMGKWAGVVFQWRVESKWHGWSVRQGRGGGGDSHTRLLHEIQNLLHELWKLAHNLLSQIIIISAEIGKLLLKMGKFVDFWKLLLETRVGWTTEPQAVPVAEPVFLRGTPRLPLSWDP